MNQDQSAVGESGPSRRAIILWGVGMLAVLGLVWFLGAVALPIFITIDEVSLYVSVPVNPAEWKQDVRSCINRMGGPKQAARRLGAYLRLPRRVAPHRGTAVRMLGECGEHALPELLRHVGHQEERVRACVATALGRAGGPSAVEALISMLEDEDPSVCRWSAMALGELGDPRAIEPLRKLGDVYLKDPEKNYDYKDASLRAIFAIEKIEAGRPEKPEKQK